MKFNTLPQGIRDLMRDKFLIMARDDFTEVEAHIADEFLDRPDIKPQWDQFKEDCFQAYMATGEAIETWQEWLRSRGVEP